jgi:hypothetical protein
MQDLLNAFAFISDHIHVAGWIFLVTISWKLSWKVSTFFSGLADKAEEGKAASEKIKDMQKTIELVATNHLPHLQESSLALLEEIKGLRRDIFQILVSRKD